MNELAQNAVIAGSNLISFSDVSGTQRSDVLDLLMYADFSATQTWRRDSQWTSWIGYYRRRLVNFGCQLQSQIVKPAMVINSASELDDISFSITGSERVSGLMDLARRSFREARLNSYARHFFEFGSDSGYASSFQIVPCEGNGADDVSILICGLHASASAVTENRGGDWRTAREMVVRLAGGVYSFNQERFGPHRQRIQSRLREVANFNLKHITI